MLFGIVVVPTPFVELDATVLYHREACAFGLQLGPELMSLPNLQYVGTEYSMDQNYGVKEMNLGKMAVLIEKP